MLEAPAVFDAAEAAGIRVGVWVSDGLAKQYGVALDTAANCDTFSERGAAFFTSDLPEEVWAWWDQRGAAASGREDEGSTPQL